MRKLKSEQVKEHNMTLTWFAQRKQLTEAKHNFDKMVEENTANVHSYAIMINVYVRCGDVEGANRTFQVLFQKKKKEKCLWAGYKWVHDC
jgi:pentatricopeptide repeat protein